MPKKDLLFVWEPTELVTSWYAHRRSKCEEKSVRIKSVVEVKKSLREVGGVYRQENIFWRGSRNFSVKQKIE